MRKRNYTYVAGLWIIAMMLVVTGCEESVDPVLETDEVFSLYGFLNPREDVQAVRLYSIDGILEISSDDPIDATVTSTNLGSGETVVWRDSVIQFFNRSYGHVFHADFRPEHDTAYEISAVRSDGRTTRVVVQTPPDGVTEIDEIFSIRSSVLVNLKWSNVPRLIQAKVTYVVTVPFPDGSDSTTVRVEIQRGRVEDNGDGTWTVGILPSEDIGTIFNALLLRPGRSPLFLERIEVSAFVVSADWESPTGNFDPELLVQPGTFSNVDNGFGFVGGGYFDTFVFELSDTDAANAGFSIN